MGSDGRDWGVDTPLRTVAGGSPMGENKDLFGDLYVEHLASVYGLASRLCGNKLGADVAQEVFLQLWQHPETFDPSKGSLRALLLTITRHKAIDHIRVESARQAREERQGSDAEGSFELDVAFLKDEAAKRVIVALNTLPPDLREAIVTAFYGRCSYREAAIVLGQPEGTIKARIRKGLLQLRVVLSDAA
jgi:RNA polymerase sigma-70 factor, ECF subfamily